MEAAITREYWPDAGQFLDLGRVIRILLLRS